MKQIRFMDTILRDAHQSLVATRMTTAQMLPILETLDECGYEALEVWGGATFDACLRFLNEDPWERLRIIRKHVKKTKLQMLLRGQNILGYKHYPDDVVEAFVQKAIENGIDVIRCFDALNDTRNLETSVKAIKKYNGHAQLCICYSISEVHTDEYYLELVRKMVEMGADSIAIKDMSGILTPSRAFELVKKIKELTPLPLQIHTHASSGISEMTYLKCVEAGADIIDTALSPLSGGTSQPATESLALSLIEMGYDTGLNMDKVYECAEYFKKVKAEFVENDLFNLKVTEITPKTLVHQVPGGMLSNLISQLKQANQLSKFDEVLKEVPLVRNDLGYPPLVTPLSQMVGTQAVMNVLTGERYKMVPNEIKDYVGGYYGKSPSEINPEIVEKILGQNPNRITVRPADLIEAGLEKFKEEIAPYSNDLEDVLSYALFPTIALPFIRKKADPFYDIEVQEVEIIF